MNVPSEFLEHVFSQPWVISTSQVCAIVRHNHSYTRRQLQPPTVMDLINETKRPDLRWMGAAFGPVAEDGYGICYRPAGEDVWLAHITSFVSGDGTDANRLGDALELALRDMLALFDLSTTE